MAPAADQPTDFDRIAVAYDLLVDESKRWANEGRTLARWLEQAGAGRRRVLDLGCGTGFHARHLAGHLNAKVVGADPAARMLAMARQKEHGDLVTWVNAAAEAPPSGPFDLILLLGNTLSLIASPAGIFPRLRAVAVPGALLAIQTLDYGALRAAGEQCVHRAGRGLSIEKRLTPHPQSSRIGATLSIIVRNPEGEILHQLADELIDHPTSRLIADAAEAAWILREQRRGYRGASSGSDRILVFAAG
jgi:SAM-dependent methyltransferase